MRLATPVRVRKGYQFILGNRGPARAEDLIFEFLPPEFGDAPGLMMEGHNFPISLDYEEYAVHAIMVIGVAPAIEVLLRWKDGTGPREKRMTLTVF